MGKQSLIPTAGRRKGACNCLCFQACRAVGFAACILWNWFPQQPDLQGGYCKLLVARGKATQASLLLERNGNRDTPAPSSTSRTRKGLTAGRPRWGPWRGWVGGWMDSRSGPRSAGQRVPLVRPQRSRAVGASLAGQQAGAVSLLQGEVWVGRRGQFWSRGITRGSGESLALLARLLHPRTCRLHRTLWARGFIDARTGCF